MTLERRTRFTNQLSALWKLALSFRKHDWDLSDYPTRIRVQGANPRFLGSRDTPPYAADIINWHLAGTGNTRDEAVTDLDNKLEAVKRERKRV